MKLRAARLKQHFLEIASPLVDDYVAAALGTGELKSNNVGCREEVWDLLKTLMLEASDTSPALTISCANDIVKAVDAGDCTIEEGEQLAKMFKHIGDSGAPLGEGGEIGKLPVLNITLHDSEGERELEKGDKRQDEGSSRGERSSEVATGQVQTSGTADAEPGTD